MIKDKSFKDVDRLLKLLHNLDKVEEIDVEQLEASMSPAEKLTLNLRQKKTLERVAKPKKPGRPKSHWKRKKRLLKARKNRYWHNTVKPRRLKEYEEYVKMGDWYSICLKGWEKKPATKNPKVTREQWNEHIALRIPEGRVVVTRRLDTRRGIELDNLEVIDSETREVYFCGLDLAVYEAMNASPQMSRSVPD